MPVIRLVRLSSQVQVAIVLRELVGEALLQERVVALVGLVPVEMRAGVGPGVVEMVVVEDAAVVVVVGEVD